MTYSRTPFGIDIVEEHAKARAIVRLEQGKQNGDAKRLIARHSYSLHPIARRWSLADDQLRLNWTKVQ